jgi:hypothetical protein
MAVWALPPRGATVVRRVIEYLIVSYRFCMISPHGAAALSAISQLLPCCETIERFF